MTSANTDEYRDLAVEQLQESPTNPRRRFNEETLQELAASFKTQGVLQPLVVRRVDNDKYEVVAGARRFRAAKLAELSTVPVRLVELTDAAAIEVQVNENLQREDVHPLEEAFGFRSLLDLNDPNYTVQSIASRIGKSEQFVVSRIRLTELSAPIAEAFLADKITIGHALLIAKLPPSQQQEAFNASFRQMWTTQGNTQVLIPVRELAAWIESNILLELATAPFSKTDEALVPEAGSCTNCPKRTGFNVMLFAEFDGHKDRCTDRQCFSSKVDSHVAKTMEAKPKLIQISSAWSSREGEPLGRNRYVELEPKKSRTASQAVRKNPAERPCEKMAEAMVMDGGRRGQIVKVCADPHCRVHHGDQPTPQQLERARVEERKRIEKERLAITVRHRVLAAVLGKVAAPLKKADLSTIVEHLLCRMPYTPQLAKRHKVIVGNETVSPEQLLRHFSTYDEDGLSRVLLEVALLDSAYQRGATSGVDPLLAAAKRYRIDTEKIEKAVTAEVAEKRKKQERKHETKKTAA